MKIYFANIRLFLILTITVCLFGSSFGVRANETEVDLELVLAVDVSRSMDIDEQLLQRDGYVSAIQHPDVISAIKQGLIGRIAVTYIEWAGHGLQKVTIPWTLIDDADSAVDFADRLEKAPIIRWRKTGISGAILFSGELFEKNNFRGLRRVIDISGDGPNNSGIPVYEARDRVVGKGITINGLPLQLKLNQWSGFFDIAKLDIYYEDCVIGGPGAFWIAVKDTKEFANAIRRKLLLEISQIQPAKIIRVQGWRRTPRIDCLIGEKRWQEYIESYE